MLRTAKTTGILLTALLLSLFYLFVFFFSYFEKSCYLSYFWQTIVFGFIYVCTCIYGLYFCLCFLLRAHVMPFYFELLFRRLTERNFRRCDAIWPFMGRQPNQFLPSVLLELFDRIRRFCDPFRALSSYLCGTCFFLYARCHWVFESPVSILASGHQGLFRTCNFGKPVGF